jgi:hypothetical protein
MTWMTPLDWKTSAVVTVAMPPLASVSMIWLPDMGGEVFPLDGLEGDFAAALFDQGCERGVDWILGEMG